jgi:hypothetical protein
MARSVGDAFTIFLSRLTPTAAERSAGAGHRESVRRALEARLQTYRFIETGSFTHGTGVRGHSDIDALISLADPRPSTSYAALESVKRALAARFPLTPVKIRRPAVVVEFGAGYQTWEVIPGYLTGRGSATQFVYDVPSPTLMGSTSAIESPAKETRRHSRAWSRRGSTTEASRSRPSISRCAVPSTSVRSRPTSIFGTCAKCLRAWIAISLPR